MLWGEDVTRAFLKDNNLKQVVRSHEVPEDLEGTCLFHEGLVITVFSASNYGGCGANKGAVLQFNKRMEYKVFDYWAPPLEAFINEKQTETSPTREPSSPPPNRRVSSDPDPGRSDSSSLSASFDRVESPPTRDRVDTAVRVRLAKKKVEPLPERFLEGQRVCGCFLRGSPRLPTTGGYLPVAGDFPRTTSR